MMQVSTLLHFSSFVCIKNVLFNSQFINYTSCRPAGSITLDRVSTQVLSLLIRSSLRSDRLRPSVYSCPTKFQQVFIKNDELDFDTHVWVRARFRPVGTLHLICNCKMIGRELKIGVFFLFDPVTLFRPAIDLS